MGAQNEEQPLSERLDLFENEFKTGNLPKLEDYVFADSDIFEVIEFLHIDLEQRFRLGQKLEVKDYILKYPKIQNHLNEVLELLKREIYWLSEKNLNPGMEYYVRSYESLSKELTLYFLEKGYSFPEINGFCVLEKIGQGGMGEVYKARQISLSRDVAIKIIRYDRIRELSESGEYRKNFQKEGQTLASINHENVVKIYDAGQYQENLHLVMEYLEGESLQKRIQKEGYLNPKLAAEMVEKIARGLSEVHKKGVIHRDLKPDNIFITLDGVPKVLDFGLARTLENADGRTKEWVFKGTPEYSSPEQSSRDGKEISVQTDVYGLGAVLYACLTGISPFPKGRDVLEVLRMVKQQEVVPVLAIRPICPKDLETICLKCLRKDPKQRYSSAIELAEDLQRYQSGMPILARPVSYYEKLSKWVARNPLVSAASSIAVIALITGTIISTLFGFYAKHQASIAVSKALEIEVKNKLLETSEKEAKKNESLAKANQKIAEEQKELSQKQLYINRIQKAYSQILLGNLNVALTELSLIPFKYKSWETDYLYSLISYSLCDLKGHTDFVDSVCFSADGKRIVSGSFDNSIKIWDAISGKEIQTLDRNSTSGERFVCFNLDGKNIIGSSGNSICIWDSISGQKIRSLQGHSSLITCIGVSSDQSSLISACSKGTLKVWDINKGKETLSIKGSENWINSICFSPDGKRFVSGGWDRTIKIWNATNGKELLAIPMEGEIYSVNYSPDGKKIAVGSWKNLEILDAFSGKKLSDLNVRGNTVKSVCFSPDGTRLISLTESRTVRIWNLISGQEISFLNVEEGVFDAKFDSDGKRIAIGCGDGKIKIWNPNYYLEPQIVKGHLGSITSASFSPDGTKIASVGSDKTLKVWNAISGKELISVMKNLKSDNRPWQYSVCFNLKGDQVISSGIGEVTVWDIISGREVFVFKDESSVKSICLSRDGKKLATGNDSNIIKIWNFDTKQLIYKLSSISDLKNNEEAIIGIKCLTFSPDGKTIISGGWDKTLRLWDVESGKEIQTYKGHTEVVNTVCFSPDGNKIISGSFDKTIKVWDIVLGKEILTLAGHTDSVTSVVISPDGKRIISVSLDKTLKIWDLDSGFEILSFEGQAERFGKVKFSPDGKSVLCTTNNGYLKIWNVTNSQDTFIFKGHTNTVNSVFLNADEKKILSEDVQGVVKLWDIESGNEVPINHEEIKKYKSLPESINNYRKDYSINVYENNIVLVDNNIRVRNIQKNLKKLFIWSKIDLNWHNKNAEGFIKNKEWFAAAFHLRKIIEIEPNNESAKKRLEVAEDNLKNLKQ